MSKLEEDETKRVVIFQDKKDAITPIKCVILEEDDNRDLEQLRKNRDKTGEVCGHEADSVLQVVGRKDDESFSSFKSRIDEHYNNWICLKCKHPPNVV